MGDEQTHQHGTKVYKDGVGGGAWLGVSAVWPQRKAREREKKDTAIVTLEVTRLGTAVHRLCCRGNCFSVISFAHTHRSRAQPSPSYGCSLGRD